MILFCQWLPVKREQVQCPSCGLSEPLALHDFIYKDRLSDAPRCVGKRLLCSQRSGRGGCGATLRLRLADEIAQRQYGMAQLNAFLLALIFGGSIEAAYCDATGAPSARNGARWLTRLHHKLPLFRTVLGSGAGADQVLARSARLSVLLSTLKRVLERTQEPSLAGFQCHCLATDLVMSPTGLTPQVSCLNHAIMRCRDSSLADIAAMTSDICPSMTSSTGICWALMP